MHKMAMEIGKKVMEEAKAKGLDNFNAEDWEKLKYTMEIIKNAICADKDYRIVCAMDEAEEEEKFMGRMGYRGRAENGRFVHRSGRGRSAGYTPYMHMMDDGMEEIGMYDDIPYPMTGYRMGYTGGRSGGSGNRGGSSNMGYADGNYASGMGNARSGYEHMGNGRYGRAYDNYDNYRRHYTETKDPEAKKMMKQSTEEIFDDMESMVESIMKYADASEKPELKQKMLQMAQKVQSMK